MPELDKSETVTGPWEYPASAKFDRLLRHCRVPIGILTDRRVVRLIYAPHGESSGSITFRLDDMSTVGGRPILDAFIMLLSAQRFFAVAPENQLPSLLLRSRKHQASVTNTLAEQVFEALEILLAGFDAAAERDGPALLREALERENDYLYGGLLTVLLRLVFILYAEDRGLMPIANPIYEEHYSLQDLYEDLQTDFAQHPDSMSRRFGAWSRLVSLFRAVFLGVEHGPLRMPPRRGELFDPHVYPFLEGWGPGGSAPINDAEERAGVRVPSVDDETVFRVLQRLIYLEGQRLSYRALDVEQIGSVYEALMGYHVERLASAGVCLRPNRVWVTVDDIAAAKGARLEAWLKEEVGLAAAQAKKLAESLKGAAGEDDVLGALESFKAKGATIGRVGRLVLQPGSERRRTSSHYTPRSLSAPIVRRTLEPLIAAMGASPSSARLLDLVICDPAMGSGAFLVEACRFLADQVVAAWTREKQLEKIADAHEDAVNHARRLVAQRCLYGVDKNRFAVNLAKLSLWLVTLAKEAPFTFVDHALRHGDSLVGLDFEQIKSFHWKAGDQLELCRKELEGALDEAIALRQQILELASEGSPASTREKERLLWDAEDALDRVRLIGDVIVGAFFAGKNDRERGAERNRRLSIVEEWLGGDEDAGAELRELQREIRKRIPVFHWMAEFPEVFWFQRPDPLNDGRRDGHAWIDAFIGNPPFGGKDAISDFGGPSLIEWLQNMHAGSHGNADYCSHFFLRSERLIGDHGTLGLIATNTIAQGDTRATALQPILRRGAIIYSAVKSMPWPVEGTSVSISIVHLAKGVAGQTSRSVIELDGAIVEAINSRLLPKRERADAVILKASTGLSFQGSSILGLGFTLDEAERNSLISRNAKNAVRILPYVGGEDVNSHPAQLHSRYVISFGQLDLDAAEGWPDLISIVRERVKPERDKNNREVRRRYWWRFGEVAPALYDAISSRSRCLVNSRVSKHLIMAWQETNRIFADSLNVFAFEGDGTFAVLQSRIHEAWARLLSSSLEDRLRYAPSDCFETYPFPKSDPGSVIPSLDALGRRLYTARASLMKERQQGLTTTYNQLKDPTNTDPKIIDLRALHEDLDRAILAAYGWSDIPVPPYQTPTTPEEEKALEAFQDEVIDRLFVLNEQRAKEEAAAGLTATKGKQKGAKAKKPASTKKPTKKSKTAAATGELFDADE